MSIDDFSCRLRPLPDPSKNRKPKPKKPTENGRKTYEFNDNNPTPNGCRDIGKF